jgi:2',3'-cyclic-nucleotide 2'-phosphodiesterase (5'-nucleotidase family)
MPRAGGRTTVRTAASATATATVLAARALAGLAAAVGLAGCSLVELLAPPPEPAPAPAARGVTILAINDVYRIEGLGSVTAGAGERGGLARVRALRRELEASGRPVLLLHAGDLLFPSLLSRRYGGAQMIDVLNLLDGDGEAFDETMFVTFGNHEFDRGGADGAALLDRRVEESEFRWLSSNVWFDDDGRQPLVAAPNLAATATVTLGGLRIGLFGLTTDLVRPDYVIGFHDREETAREAAALLRAGGADAVVALTHLDLEQDLALLEALGDAGPDLVIGGHDHTRAARRGAGGRWVLKADADAASAVVVEIVARPEGGIEIASRAVELGPGGPAPDPEVAARVTGWLDRFDREQCAADGLPAGCLAQALGRTRVPLIAEETEIRRYETNLGNWIADRLRAHFAAPVEAADPGAPLVAFVNSGSLRLNQDLPAGYVLRRHLDELFAYPAPPRLLRLDGATLKKVAARAVESWSAAGHWLQISGFAFVHDPEAGTATNLTLLTPEGPRPLGDRDRVYAATVGYLVDPAGDRDGYAMLGPQQVVSSSQTDLRTLVVDELARKWEEAIAPAVEGRICNTERAGPCLAVHATSGRAAPRGGR